MDNYRATGYEDSQANFIDNYGQMNLVNNLSRIDHEIIIEFISRFSERLEECREFDNDNVDKNKQHISLKELNRIFHDSKQTVLQRNDPTGGQ